MKQVNGITLVLMVTFLLCASLIFGTSASAADNNACSEDVAKFCQNIKPGILALMDCLEKNENKLTSACKEYEAKLLGSKVEKREKFNSMNKFRRDCQNDMASFCNDASQIKGGMLKCLNDHKAEISSSCSQSLELVY